MFSFLRMEREVDNQVAAPAETSAENEAKRGSITQSQAKRINEIAFPWSFRNRIAD
jgi:hypothetical protein